MSHAEAAESFEAMVVDFCQHLEQGDMGRSSLEVLLRRLDAAARELPLVEPSDAEYGDPADLGESCRQVAGRVGILFGHQCFYELVSEAEATIGDLRDDLSDIYRDLRRGLAVAQQSTVDAIWEWRFNHEVHWGIHARDALAALDALGDE